MPRLRIRLGVRVLNAQGVSERRPQDEIEAGILAPFAHGGEVDVWLLSEIAWADLSAIAAKHGLYALQYGERGSAEAGVGILSRTPLVRARMAVGSRPVPGVRMRPLVSARGAFGVKWTAGHAPPPRTPAARALYLAQVRTIGGVVAGDFNQTPAWMRRSFLRKYRGVGVLGLLIPRRYKASESRAVEVGSDHPAVDVVVWVPIGKARQISRGD